MAFGGEVNDSLPYDRLYFAERNHVFNPFTGVQNPVRISYNAVQTLTHATLKHRFSGGNFRAIDAPKYSNDLSMAVFGLQKMGRFTLEGTMNYIRTNERQQRWSNTLLRSADNPFVLADSLSGDPSQELFTLNATVCYAFSERWRAALALNYITGSRDDQTDPRPRVASMRFMAHPGVVFNVAPKHLLGLDGYVRIYSSDLSHTIVDNLNANVYFLMKGMGDNFTVNTADNPSYPRHYQGAQWGFSGLWKAPFFGAENILEAGFSQNDERAEDGGSGAVFKGGDYTSARFHLANRWLWHADTSLFHSLELHFEHQADEGWWYDQRRKTDPQHGNISYYEVLHKGKVHLATGTTLSFCYQTDRFLHGNPLWMARLKGSFCNRALTHYEADVYRQHFNTYTLGIEGARHFIVKGIRCRVSAALSYGDAIGNSHYETVRGKIADAYTARVFSFETARHLTGSLKPEVVLPLRLYGTATWLTAFCHLQHAFFLGKGRFSPVYNHSTRTVIDTGLSLSL